MRGSLFVFIIPPGWSIVKPGLPYIVHAPVYRISHTPQLSVKRLILLDISWNGAYNRDEERTTHTVDPRS